MKCQINGENLDCILILPNKFQKYIEGLVGNFNGDYSDDLVNQGTSSIVSISPATNRTLIDNDAEVWSACQSCKFIE